MDAYIIAIKYLAAAIALLPADDPTRKELEALYHSMNDWSLK